MTTNCQARRARRRRPHAGFRTRQFGTTLFVSLTALAGLSLAGAAMMRTADTSTLIVGNIGFHGAAVHSTDLAMEAAFTVLAPLASSAASHNHIAGSHYYASLDDTAPNAMQPPASRLSALVGNLIADAATGNTLRSVIERMCSTTGAPSPLTCLIEDSGSPVFRITTLVIGPRNTSAVVQQFVTASGFQAHCAVMTQESVSFHGTIAVSGSGNCVHSNRNVHWTNSPSSLVGQVGASGTITGDVAAAGGTANPGAPSIIIPEINPGAYAQHADYVLKADGRILDKSSALVQDTVASGPWWGWELHTTGGVTRWRKSNTAPSPEGLYFVEGHVTSHANVGAPGAPWRVSIMATGSINLSGGTAHFEDYKGADPNVPDGVKDVFLMAGGDIRFRGSFSPSAVPGSIMANEEIDVAGANGFNGNIVARNSSPADPAWVDNVASSNRLSGSTTIAYQPTALDLPFANALTRRQWRSVAR